MIDERNPPRVLIVDDEASLRDEVEEFLNAHDIGTRTASDGARALGTLADDPTITVVLTDIRMPDLDGISLATRLRGARSEADATEVVLMTGHANLDNATEAVRAGVFDFLRKPMLLDDMLVVIRRAHAKAQARREAHSRQMAEMETLRADHAALQARFARVSGLESQETPPELARVLSHELRTPLMPIIGLSDLLGDGFDLPAAAWGAYLRDVRLAGERILAIANDLIEFLAPPKPADFTFRPVEPKAILTRLFDAHIDQARSIGVALRIDGAADSAVTTDAQALITALGRLVANAFAASPPHGAVTLSAAAGGSSSAGQEVAFSVRDQGGGMTAEQIAQARKPFHQLDMSLTRQTGRLGLGLTLADRTADRLGGRLEIDSTPGQGTVAGITLPCKRAP